MSASMPSSPTPNSEIDRVRQEYQYNYTHIPPVAMVDRLPSREKPSLRWYFLLAEVLGRLFVNTLIANRGNRGDEGVRDDVKKFIWEVLCRQSLPTQTKLIAKNLTVLPKFLLPGTSIEFKDLKELLLSLFQQKELSLFGNLLKDAGELLMEGHPTGHATSLEDYEKLFPYKKLFPETGGEPAIANTFQEDEVFAYMRVAGYNPLMLERVSVLDGRFPVTDSQYQGVMGREDSLEAAGQEGRLYLADYKILEGALNGTFPEGQKFLYAPLALFAVPRGSGSSRLLRPVAIQGGQIPGPDNPIFTPESGKYAWLFAKTLVEIADANFHEAVSHLARTHLFVGAFVMATHRQLADSHPLSRLLRPHFEGTLAINNAAQEMLIAPRGGVDRLLSSTIDNSRVLAVKGLQTYGFNAAILPRQLKQRGVEDGEGLPVYPYRDDALLVWEAIHQWVSDYLSLYYGRDEDVRQDRQLQAWAGEAQAEDGGRVPDFGEEGGIQTRDYLIDAVTLIIFTASAQHAAVNFPQQDLMSYAPAVPMAGYLPASTLSGEVSERDYLNLLPPLEQAQSQLNLLYLLGSVYYNRLGEYPSDHFLDPQVKPLLQAFQANLAQVEATIEQRNLKRPPYPYLLPSRIPQSINI